MRLKEAKEGKGDSLFTLESWVNERREFLGILEKGIS
jgi:hypothetical protein